MVDDMGKNKCKTLRIEAIDEHGESLVVEDILICDEIKMQARIENICDIKLPNDCLECEILKRIHKILPAFVKALN